MVKVGDPAPSRSAGPTFSSLPLRSNGLSVHPLHSPAAAMAPLRLPVGALVFVTSRHVEGVAEHAYGRVLSVQGGKRMLRLCGPGREEDIATYEVAVSVLKPRVVDEAEAQLWSFVGHPIAFVHPDGKLSASGIMASSAAMLWLGQERNSW